MGRCNRRGYKRGIREVDIKGGGGKVYERVRYINKGYMYIITREGVHLPLLQQRVANQQQKEGYIY